jgi:hypothetical protein
LSGHLGSSYLIENRSEWLIVDAEVTALLTDIGQVPETERAGGEFVNSFNWNSSSHHRIYSLDANLSFGLRGFLYLHIVLML